MVYKVPSNPNHSMILLPALCHKQLTLAHTGPLHATSAQLFYVGFEGSIQQI